MADVSRQNAAEGFPGAGGVDVHRPADNTPGGSDPLVFAARLKRHVEFGPTVEFCFWYRRQYVGQSRELGKQ